MTAKLNEILVRKCFNKKSKPLNLENVLLPKEIHAKNRH